MRHTHYDVQLSYPSQTAGIRTYNKDILDNFIGIQAAPLQCWALGHGPIDRWLSPPLLIKQTHRSKCKEFYLKKLLNS